MASSIKVNYLFISPAVREMLAVELYSVVASSTKFVRAVLSRDQLPNWAGAPSSVSSPHPVWFQSRVCQLPGRKFLLATHDPVVDRGRKQEME